MTIDHSVNGYVYVRGKGGSMIPMERFSDVMYISKSLVGDVLVAVAGRKRNTHAEEEFVSMTAGYV